MVKKLKSSKMEIGHSRYRYIESEARQAGVLFYISTQKFTLNIASVKKLKTFIFEILQLLSYREKNIDYD